MEKALESGSNNKALDTCKWLLGLSVIGGTIALNSIYGEYPLLYRVLCMIVAFAVAAGILSFTEKGASFIQLVKEARLEARKIVWPDRQDTLRTTLFVLVVVMIFSVILWILDNFLGWLVSSLIG